MNSSDTLRRNYLDWNHQPQTGQGTDQSFRLPPHHQRYKSVTTYQNLTGAHEQGWRDLDTLIQTMDEPIRNLAGRRFKPLTKSPRANAPWSSV